MSIFGGWLSDSYLGKFKTIIFMSFIYVLGSSSLAVSAVPGLMGTPPNPLLTFFALILIGVGTGGIKPNISSFVGDQFEPTSTEAITGVFAVFYFLINAGSLISTTVTPIIKAQSNYAYAFGLPAILLLVATVLFISGGFGYTKYKVPKGPSVFSIFYNTIHTAWVEKNKVKRLVGPFIDNKPFLDYAKEAMGENIVNDVRSVLNVFYVFLPLPIFWSLYDQHSSRWVFMAQEMNTKLGNVKFEAEQVQILNPLLLLMMIPVFDRLIYPFFSRRGIFLHPLKHKMVLGMILTLISFALSGALQIYVDTQPANTVSVFMMLPQFWVLSCAEILVSITGLEFAYSQAPQWMKSLVMAGWLLTTALGNALVAALTLINIGNRGMEFFLYAALMALFTMIFYLMVKGYVLKTVSSASEEEHASQPLIKEND